MKKKKLLIVLFAAGLLIRLGLSLQGAWGHPTDQACFFVWAKQLYEFGPGDFYQSTSFCDYPPGYFYILYPLGWLFTKLNLEYIQPLAALLLRLPAVLADLGIAWLLSRIAFQKREEKAGLITAAALLFCPLLILNSAVWAQIDSVWCFFLILAILWRNHRIKSAAALAVSLLIKPQALLFFPMMAAFYFDKSHPIREYAKALITGVLMVAVFSLPFCRGDYTVILEKYLGTMTGGYPYATINAFNLYGLLGANWAPIDQPFLFATYGFWGKVMIVVGIAAGLLCFFRWKKSPWLSAAVMMTTLFLFGPMMHERYWFPAILLLAAAYADSREENKLCLYSFLAAAAVNFLNVLTVLIATLDDYSQVAPSAITVISLLTLGAGAFIYYATGKEKSAP